MSRAPKGELAHVAWEPSGRWILVVAVLGYSRAVWAEFVDEPTSVAVGLALLHGARFFGGSPSRWQFEYPDCWVVHEERDRRRWHFLSPLPELARCLSAELSVVVPRSRGLAEKALDDLAWEFVLRRALARRADPNRALRAFLDERVRKQPHPTRRDRSIAEMLVEERGYLYPLGSEVEALEAELERRGRGAS